MRRSSDPELQRRGRLLRSLSAFREMLPGSFVEVHSRCGKPNCRCADGIHLHPAFRISMVWQGKPQSFYVPAAWAEEIRAQVAMWKRAQETVAAIVAINLRRFLRRKREWKRQPPRATPPV
jgi:hypothetical protein